MKNVSLILIAVSLSLMSASCNKTYTCNCSYNDSLRVHATEFSDIKGSKDHAFHECCTMRKAQLEDQGKTNVLCAIPI